MAWDGPAPLTCTSTSSASAARSWAASRRSRRPPAIASPAATRTSIRRCPRQLASARHRADRGLRRGTARRRGGGRRPVRRRQRGDARQPADGGDPRSRPRLHVRAGMAARPRCSRTASCSPSAGTHGKTTMSAMLAWILEYAGLAPGFLIGGVPLDFGVSARHSDSGFFVIEADEYDTAFFDKRIEVRPLPPAHADPQQPRVRPRRHLPRHRRDRDAVPPSRPHGPGQRAHRRQCRGR